MIVSGAGAGVNPGTVPVDLLRFAMIASRFLVDGLCCAGARLVPKIGQGVVIGTEFDNRVLLAEIRDAGLGDDDQLAVLAALQVVCTGLGQAQASAPGSASTNCAPTANPSNVIAILAFFGCAALMVGRRFRCAGYVTPAGFPADLN